MTWTWNEARRQHNAMMDAAGWLDLRGLDLYGADLRWLDLSGADLSGADLSGANLRGLYLSRADLSGANLRGACYGEGIPLTREPIQILGLRWEILILDTHIKIGCELHSADEWAAFDDEEIADMAEGAIEFWRKHRVSILAMADAAHNQANREMADEVRAALPPMLPDLEDA